MPHACGMVEDSEYTRVHNLKVYERSIHSLLSTIIFTAKWRSLRGLKAGFQQGTPEPEPQIPGKSFGGKIQMSLSAYSPEPPSPRDPPVPRTPVLTT